MTTSDQVMEEPIRLDDENRDELERLYEQKKVVKFDWENRWLKGEEYFYILANMENYAKLLGIEKFGVKKHPESIYIEPINGLLYFVKGNSIGSEFGFPRLGIKKKYKWKKMNFTTDLPKRDPLVSYIVASAVKWEKFFPGSNKDGPCYRMHAVILKKRKSPVYAGCQVNPKWYSYILCHVRKVKLRGGANEEEWASNDNREEVPGKSSLNEGEESKVSKTGNKRGRPRKNPLLIKEESSGPKSKRGRKPKKLYDIDPSEANEGVNVTFNESEHKDNTSEEYPIHESEVHKNMDSPLGPIEKNLKMIDNQNFSFDSMVNLGKGDNYPSNYPPFYPRKQSINNPFDKFFNGAPQNLDYVHERRSRRVSSVLSPYNMPCNPPNIASPSPIRGPSFSNNDFKLKNFVVNKGNTQQSGEENPTQQKLNELIAQSFKNWNNKPKRKETEEIDFSANDNPILNILNKSASNGPRKASPFDFISNSIMSPDYKPRSFSINSNGWAMPPHAQLEEKRSRLGWDFDPSGGPSKAKPEESRAAGGNEPRVIKISTFTRNEDYKTPGASQRKNTMIDPPNTIKQASPLFFPKFSAAFKPFKKRAHSFHTASNGDISMHENRNGSYQEPSKKREIKELQKVQEHEEF